MCNIRFGLGLDSSPSSEEEEDDDMIVEVEDDGDEDKEGGIDLTRPGYRLLHSLYQ